MYKTDTNEAKSLRAITKWGAIEKTPILLSNIEKFNILKVHQKLFRILGASIIFLSCVIVSHMFIVHILAFTTGKIGIIYISSIKQKVFFFQRKYTFYHCLDNQAFIMKRICYI